MNSVQFEIGGKKRKFTFGLGFLGDILHELNINMMELGEMMLSNPYKAVPSILYYSHAYEVKKSGEIVDFTIYDFNEWIEQLDGSYQNKEIDAALSVLLESMKKNIPNFDGSKDDSKKK